MSINFCTIASGSSGNSVFVSTHSTKILIDAGLSGKTIEAGLRSNGINCAEIDAIFVTHEHTDHIKGVGVLSRRYNLPIYATAGTWDYFAHFDVIGKIADHNKLFVTPDTPIVMDDMEVVPFDIPHDASQPVGYTIKTICHKIAIATDLGHINDNVAKNIHEADVILIESNHDLQMLTNGSYPAHLKRRILSNTGHLSNVSCGRFLADTFSTKTKHIFLGHLSQENNRPILAYETVKDILLANKIDVGGSVGLYLADRHRPSAMLSL
ncbi:MAG: MBL fold metallo-hydrolase [Defluviitaleaceae bacterium]|nr:MBL fold metallo-hydrolase [Defluviitaleaceae bacterium]